MSGMWDATCTACGKRFGWRGELKDKPPCPKCLMYESPEDRAVDIMLIDRLLIVSYEATKDDLVEMQKQSGLSVGQLASTIRVPVSTIRKVVDPETRGSIRLHKDYIRKWVDACGFGEE